MVLLNAADDVKQVAGLGIAIRPEHAHEAFGRLVGEGTQFFEPNGRVDVVPEYDLACVDVSGKQEIDTLFQQPLSEGWVA